MLTDGMELTEGSIFKNLTVTFGTTFPANPSIGELFYHTTLLALQVFNGVQWDSASSSKQADIDLAITNLKGGVTSDGDSLFKLRALISGLQTLVSSDDVNLDTLQEVVTRVKTDEGLLTSLTTGKVNVADILNVLDSTDTSKPLGASQGKVLNDAITNLTATVTAINATLSTTAGGMSSIFGNFAGAVSTTVGTARYYASRNIAISKVNAWVGLASSSDLVVSVLMNGTVVQSITIPAGQIKVSVTPVTPINVTPDDYLTITIAGSGTDLTIRLDY